MTTYDDNDGISTASLILIPAPFMPDGGQGSVVQSRSAAPAYFDRGRGLCPAWLFVQWDPGPQEIPYRFKYQFGGYCSYRIGEC